LLKIVHWLPVSNFPAHLAEMQRLKPDVDIVLDILKAVAEAQPLSSFAQSILHQYQERGGLSKKQLEGLYNKASKVKTILPGKLATLEAIILKKPNRYKSALPAAEPLYKKDEAAGQLIESILAKYPQHKRVLFLKSKHENNEVLTAADLAELQKFGKLLK
jgi:DNA repair protein RadC